MNSYLNGTALLVGYTKVATSSNTVIGDDVIGAGTGQKTEQTSAERFAALRKLSVPELKARADRVVDELSRWQTNLLSSDNSRAYADAFEQARWQKSNGDNAKDEEEKRLAYARCVHMAENSLLAFTRLGPGDSYWDTYLETLKKGAELARDAARNLLKAPGNAFQWFTGIPAWVFWCTAGAAVLGVGYGVWKVAVTAGPTLVNKYLP